MKIAVYDVGTNSIHLLIVEVHKDLSFEILDHEKDAARIGDGSFEKGRLTKTAMKRAFAALERFRKIADKCGAHRTIAVATSAVREAANGDEFVRQVRRRTGIRLKIISGREEARLIFLAARSAVETRGENALVIDIGGGSTELILGDASRHHFLESYKLGVARLTDHFFLSDPPSKKEIRRLEEHVEEVLGKACKRVRKAGFARAIGTAGTMISLAVLAHQIEKGRPLQLVSNFPLERKTVDRIARRLSGMALKDRLKVPGLDPKRADIVVAGAVMVARVMKLLRLKRIIISDKGIREGVILDYIARNGLKLKRGVPGMSIRERSVRQLARRCDFDEAHAEQVARLALELFDRTASLHRLGEAERDLLRYASLLHDIGHYVSFRKHHKHTHYLIVNSELDGFSPEEVEVLGAVARAHRKPAGKLKYGHFVGKKGRRTIKALASILRIADGLDRSYHGVVKSLSCRLTPGTLALTLRVSQDAELEMWQAKERADLFEKLYKRRLAVQAVRTEPKG